MYFIIGGLSTFKVKKSLNYSPHLERISFSSLRKLPEGSLTDEQMFDILPGKRRIVCKITMFADE